MTLIYEDELPEDMTTAEMDAWYTTSEVVDGVRMGFKPTTVPLNVSIPWPMVKTLKSRKNKIGIPVSRQVQDAVRGYFASLEEKDHA